MENPASINKVLDDELQKGDLLLISFRSKEYRENLKALAKNLMKRYKICFVSLNDPFDTAISRLAIDGCSNLLFIDCVTSMVRQPKPRQNVTFVSSPHALTEISISMKKSLQQADFLLFDSISTMLIYEKPSTVLRFIYDAVSALRSSKKPAVFVILKEDTSNELLKDISILIDRTLEI